MLIRFFVENVDHSANVVSDTVSPKVICNLIAERYSVNSMEKQSQQVNVRVSVVLLTDLRDAAAYEGATVPELLREWIREKIRQYRKDRRFEEWRAKKD